MTAQSPASEGFRPLKQLYRHDPENGVYGDCFRTSVAMVLGMQPQDVPHFCDADNGNWRTDFEAWLDSLGLTYTEVPYAEAYYEAMIEQMRMTANETAVMAFGTSPRGTLHEVVIYKGEVFDPHPDGGCLVSAHDGFYWLRFITPKAGCFSAFLTERTNHEPR